MQQSDYNKSDKRINAGYCAILVHCRAATAARGQGKTVKVRRNSHYRERVIHASRDACHSVIRKNFLGKMGKVVRVALAPPFSINYPVKGFLFYPFDLRKEKK